MEQQHWFDEAIKILGWLLLISVIFGAFASGPNGLALLAVVLAVFAVNFLIHGIVKIGEGITRAGSATLEAMSKIRITLPKRPPNKREIAAWFLGEYRINEEILESMPLDEELEFGRNKNKANLVDNIDRLLEDK